VKATPPFCVSIALAKEVANLTSELEKSRREVASLTLKVGLLEHDLMLQYRACPYASLSASESGV